MKNYKLLLRDLKRERKKSQDDSRPHNQKEYIITYTVFIIFYDNSMKMSRNCT